MSSAPSRGSRARTEHSEQNEGPGDRKGAAHDRGRMIIASRITPAAQDHRIRDRNPPENNHATRTLWSLRCVLNEAEGLHKGLEDGEVGRADASDWVPALGAGEAEGSAR